MGRYITLWETDMTRAPVNPKERQAAFLPLVEMVKQDMKKGLTKDWGMFVGETNGYAVLEGTELEIMIQMQKYLPFVKFEVHPIASVSQVEEMLKALTK